jgi:hypothetical protein
MNLVLIFGDLVQDEMLMPLKKDIQQLILQSAEI